MDSTTNNKQNTIVLTSTGGMQETRGYYAREEKIPALIKTRSTYKGNVYVRYSTSRVHLPASWAGKTVLCVLLEEPGTVPEIEPTPEPAQKLTVKDLF